MITKVKYGEHGRIILEATCDICGSDCMKPLYTPNTEGDGDDEVDMDKEFEGMELSADWGYGSNDKDGESWRAVICEDCVDEHLSKVVFFTKEDYM